MRPRPSSFLLLCLLPGFLWLVGSFAQAQESAIADPGTGVAVAEYDLTRRMSSTPANPATYLLRPGDTVKVTVLTGETDNIDLDVQLALDGSIALPWVPPLELDGLTLAQASTLVQQAYAQIYRRAFAQVALIRLGTFQVVVGGYVVAPGLYRVFNGTTLYGLLLALDLETDGERRFLRLERIRAADNDTAEAAISPNLLTPELVPLGAFDAFDFSVRGHMEQDVFLEAFDRVTVERPETVIRLDSGVLRPGSYAVRPGETLADILLLAGEVNRTFDLQNTILTRLGPDGTPEFMYVDLASSQPIELQDRDRLTFVPYKSTVYLLGEVGIPGEYPVMPGENIVELIAKAGGPTREAYTKTISIVRPSRMLADRLEAHTITMFDLRTVTKAGNAADLPMQIKPGDIIFIPTKRDRITPANILSAASVAVSRIVGG